MYLLEGDDYLGNNLYDLFEGLKIFPYYLIFYLVYLFELSILEYKSEDCSSWFIRLSQKFRLACLL